jgi:tetratricopeptide (TPR) repeat protein
MTHSSLHRAAHLRVLSTILLVLSASTASAQTPPSAADSAFQRKDFAAAVAGYEKTVAANAADSAAWFSLGASYQALGNQQKALEAYTRVRKTAYRPVALRFRLARVYAHMGNAAAAVALLDTANAMGPGSVVPAQLAAEKDFDPIRNDAAFKKVVAEIGNSLYPCRTSPEARQFDFWIGKWDVTPWSGVGIGAPGFNDVHPILEHCVVFENWRAGNGTEGKSFNYYDTSLKKWRQIWMADTGGALDYTGEFRDGAMRFTGWILDGKGNRLEQKLTFTPIDANTVRQTFEQSSDAGKTWIVTFDGKYVRQKQ